MRPFDAEPIILELRGDRQYPHSYVNSFMREAEAALQQGPPIEKEGLAFIANLEKVTFGFRQYGVWKEIGRSGGALVNMMAQIGAERVLEGNLMVILHNMEKYLGFGLLGLHRLNIRDYQLDLQTEIGSMDLRRSSLEVGYHPVPKILTKK